METPGKLSVEINNVRTKGVPAWANGLSSADAIFAIAQPMPGRLQVSISVMSVSMVAVHRPPRRSRDAFDFRLVQPVMQD